MSRLIVTAALGTLLACTVVSSPATAANGAYFQNAVGLCNGALPGFEGALRKRPLGIANEGTGNAIVSCAVPADQYGNLGNVAVGVALGNSTGNLVAISCTFVDGTSPKLVGAIPPTYRTKNIALGPDAGDVVSWTATEFGIAKFSPVASFSCSLPPGVELLGIASVYEKP